MQFLNSLLFVLQVNAIYSIWNLLEISLGSTANWGPYDEWMAAMHFSWTDGS